MKYRVIAVLLLAVAGPAAAQGVGYAPDKSPYHDIVTNYGFSLLGGYVAGSGGRLDIGPKGGPIGGVRYEMSIGGPTDVVFDAGYMRLTRKVVDPNADTLTRLTGPVTQPALVADVGLNVLLTGRKTWRRLAPYVGASLGMAFGGSVAQDTSGYNFNAKFMVGPQLGVRWDPADNFTVRLEGRDLFWQLKYPSSFFATPSRAPNQPSVLDAATDPSSEWVQHPTLVLTIGFALR